MKKILTTLATLLLTSALSSSVSSRGLSRGKQLPLYKTEESDVMILQERVAEAQRIAKTVSYYF